jgi:chondroitin 4-sulfotransferase 11
MLAKWVKRYPDEYERVKASIKRTLPLANPVGRCVSRFASELHQKYWEDFVFIHIPKCGGTSIERALGIPLLNHDTALERRAKLGANRWNRRPKFTVVRNPYCRIASLFFYWEKLPELPRGEVEQRFLRWLRWTEKRLKEPRPNRHLRSQVWWSSDESGDTMMDFVCHLEAIEQDVAKIEGALGRTVHVPRIKTNRIGISYESLFSGEAEEIVWRLYQEDFECFGYERFSCHFAASEG